MKPVAVKRAIVTASILAVSSFANTTLAHTLNGSLGSGAGATDYYLITCAPDAGENSSSLEARVKDNSPVAAPLVSVQVVRARLAANATDLSDGNTTYSPNAKVNGGNGTYIVMVNKTTTGSESYSLEYHCKAANGVHTATSISTQQNQ